MRFKDRVAIVTGGGGGVGLSTALGLLREGASVGVIDVKPRPSDYDAYSDRVHYVVGDLADPSEISRFVADIAARFGSPNHLANIAGVAMYGRDGSVVDMPLEHYQRTIAVNLDAVIHMIRETVPHMRRTKPCSMVHIASVVGVRSMDNAMKDGPLDAYQISKASVISLSRSLAIDLGREGIRSNTVSPGALWTPMTESIYVDPARVEAMANRTPLRRVGHPDDVAAACLFLLSEDADFITGVDLPVDGGLLAKLV
ncbi:SDR family NAD(P)-dependent oxidoreductase [Mesorhizobium sp. CO1-1-8]|uniref:SDR family NAD(P)-dependent oxidoreductase n=1 Tax=Mesorhizobium sp. CO1-1-8 TaxID=2876631 RepID=UPI001CD08817|nr:SDR family oxidoreductase [Mesorhizobium sp. CO1-1-8]MBZ9772551.1 SDR family oxidoreductase [Mesorhizobium sp. CO1-1-8]